MPLAIWYTVYMIENQSMKTTPNPTPWARAMEPNKYFVEDYDYDEPDAYEMEDILEAL